jgi:pyridoxine 5'-phosphate synthase PdxJ
LLHELERIQPAGRWPVWSALERALTPDSARGITVFVGDFHERSDEIRSAVKRLSGAHHEVICFQVLGDVERQFAYRGTVTLEELETGRRLDLVGEQAQEAATANLEQQLRELRYAVEESGAVLVPCLLAQPFEAPLREYLGRRDRRA